MGAMNEEINAFLGEMTVALKEKKAGLKFYIGKLADHDVIVVHSGIGKVNAALATQILIDRYKCRKIVFTGLAGSGRRDIAIGDYVLADSLVQHDFDLRHFGREKGMVPAVGKFMQADKELNRILEESIVELGKEKPGFGKFNKGIIATGDLFVADSKVLAEITAEFNAAAVEMEGAAMAQVCFLNEVPFAVLRTISDNADETALSDFKAVLDKASVEEVEILKKMLTKLN